MWTLRQNTATSRVFDYPAFDKTDGITPETALVITAETIFMDLNPADNAVAPSTILDNVAAATTGDNALNYHNAAAGKLKIAIPAANITVLGKGTYIISNSAVHCPIVQHYEVLSPEVYDSLERGIGLPASSWV